MSPPPGPFGDDIVALLPRLRRFARTLARNPHDADDLVQIAVERAWRNASQWQPETSLASWLFGIVRNAWIDEIRSRGRRAALFTTEDAAEHVGSSDTEAAIEVWSLESALMTLPEEQRSAVMLVLVEGLSYKEAAAALDVPIGTVTSRLARGREALAAVLDAAPAGNDP